MAEIKHMIEPERLGLWVAVTFVIALLALVVSLIGFNASKNLMYMTQTEVLLLNKKIETLHSTSNSVKAPTQQE
jgi:uncharacterized membrane protein